MIKLSIFLGGVITGAACMFMYVSQSVSTNPILSITYHSDRISLVNKGQDSVNINNVYINYQDKSSIYNSNDMILRLIDTSLVGVGSMFYYESYTFNNGEVLRPNQPLVIAKCLTEQLQSCINESDFKQIAFTLEFSDAKNKHYKQSFDLTKRNKEK